MKLFDVNCPIHGNFEVSADRNSTDNRCPTICPIVDNGKVCGQPLSKMFPVVSTHYKDGGYTGAAKNPR